MYSFHYSPSEIYLGNDLEVEIQQVSMTSSVFDWIGIYPLTIPSIPGSCCYIQKKKTPFNFAATDHTKKKKSVYFCCKVHLTANGNI